MAFPPLDPAYFRWAHPNNRLRLNLLSVSEKSKRETKGKI